MTKNIFKIVLELFFLLSLYTQMNGVTETPKSE